jgi:hypothetical protein
LGKDVNDPTENLTYYDQEMQDCAENYCSFVMEQIEEAKKHCPDPQVLIEQRLDFSRWVENGFGTGDCVIVADDVLQIIDYKHGLGVLVSAEKNPQMMCYALGAKTILNPSGEIKPLLYQNLRIRAVLLCFLNLFHYETAVVFSAVLHLLIVVGKILGWIIYILTQLLFYQIGAQFMTVRTLLCIRTCPVLLL